jgi:hypothetical protein
LINCDTGDVHKCEFYESQQIENHTLCSGINELLSLISEVIVQFGWNSVQEMVRVVKHQFLWACVKKP